MAATHDLTVLSSEERMAQLSPEEQAQLQKIQDIQSITLLGACI